MLAAATICDSQGIKNIFFLKWVLGIAFPSLIYLALVSSCLLHGRHQGRSNTDGSWASGTGDKEDI